MSRLYGSIRQIAFVVRDLEGALGYWTDTLGVGPFFLLRRIAPADYRYRGAPSPAPCLSLALGNSGDVQVELIEQHDDRPSAYRDFLASGREGLQHVSSWLTRAEYDAIMAGARAHGVVAVHEGAIPGSDVRFAYFATDTAPGGLVYEIADVMEPHIYPLMQMIADAARGWDGRDPVRELGLG
jgi:catechol 2,3-dioxygenase-like lactoylglutathione lyase family enzyme